MIAYLTQHMINNITYGTFFFFGSSVVIGVIFVFFFSLPETKKISLKDMDVMFNVRGFAWHKRAETDRIQAERRAELHEEQESFRMEKGIHSHVELSRGDV